MTEAKILGLATGVPDQRYSQRQIYEAFLQPFLGANRKARVIFWHAGVGYRHTVVDGSYYRQERGTQERNERYLEEALPLGQRVIRQCLEESGLSPQDIDDLIVISCTGVDTPGLDLRLAGLLGMRPDLNRTCILGMGCYAAFPGLLRARQAAISQPDRKTLLLALELCSLHFQPGDASTENVVSSALFADGAAAAVIGSGKDGANTTPALVDALTHCDYQTFDHMAFHLTDHGFRMSLSAYVPELLAVKLEEFIDELLQRNQLTRADVRFWGVHPGSAKILDYTAERLELSEQALACSRDVLYRYGNMSSATVLFVLKEIQEQCDPQPGDYGVLMAFGPGLTLESALIRW